MMELKWSKNKASGILTAKTGYQASIEEEVRGEKLWWCKVIWKSDNPLKIRILLWLALANGICPMFLFKVSVERNSLRHKWIE
jgi:hypothetical protein